MATVPCTVHLISTSSNPKSITNSPSILCNFGARFLGVRKNLGFCRKTSGIGPSCGSRTTCWFKFGKNGVDAEGAGIYGSQSRDDFDRDDVEQAIIKAEAGKVAKHEKACLENEHVFVPFAFDTFGALAADAVRFLKRVQQVVNGNTAYAKGQNFVFSRYFNYMGMLAVEGTYDKMEALLRQNIHPVDILLMMAASEGDKPKLEELLKAGAKYDVKDVDGKTAVDKASNDEIKNFILNFSTQNA